MTDGLVYGVAWAGEITYSFPAAETDYSYQQETLVGFEAISDKQVTASLFALEQSAGSTSNDGFSIEGFTNASLSFGAADSANIRIAQSAVPITAYTYMPGTVAEAGDVWLGIEQNYESAQAGNYAWHTIMHEIGHAMGLKHGHAAYGDFAALPSNYDSPEYTVMTYRSYENGPTSQYTYGTWSAPQTYMMADIAALQHIYGADFTTNSGRTTYRWSPENGDTFVNGKRGIDAGGDKIFATVWDGGGIDTYDLRAYHTDLKIDLRPGEASIFDRHQLADLGRNHHASGNIYNALQYEGDSRSLIENAFGGYGDDEIRGNDANNNLTGRRGRDQMNGDGGTDHLKGGFGNDWLFGGDGNDRLSGGRDNDKLIGGTGNDVLFGRKGADTFIFNDNSGHDTIADYRDGIDKIDLSQMDDVSMRKVLSRADRVGHDIVITLAPDTSITIHDLKLSHLNADDFQF